MLWFLTVIVDFLLSIQYLDNCLLLLLFQQQYAEGKEPSLRHHHPSISIQPDESLQLTEELLENSEVESKDIINSKAMGSNTLERVTVFDQSDEEDESDQDRAERREQSEDEDDEDEEEGTDGGVSKQGSSTIPPSDSVRLTGGS